MIAACLLVSLVAAASNAVPVSKTTSLHSAYPTITTTLGDVQGAILNTRQGKNIYSFRGVRYAKAPVDDLRFQNPVPVEKWDIVYNATQDGPACPQPGVENTSEDCLLLNVYTTKIPKANDNPKRPVIVFFHDGDFTNNSAVSTSLGPQYLLDQDIVLVTANYRLGVLGFLNTGDKEATGNYGLKDQVEVLKWVKSHVLSFGGNPDMVTVAGSGSGGYSVSLHLVSPLSKGLFHRAIIAGGSAFGHIQIPNSLLELSKKLAKELGCSDDTSSNVVKCFKGKSVQELTEHQSALKESMNDPYFTWMPTMEQDLGQPRFLKAHPIELANHDELEKVPLLIGVNTDEFACRAFSVVNNETLLGQFDTEFDKVAPISFMYERETDHSKAISKSLRTFYFADSKIDNTQTAKLVELYSDALVGFGVNRAVDLIADKSNESVFYYRFNFNGKYSNFYLPESNGSTPYGVIHGDDLIYLFQTSKFPNFKDGEVEITTLQKMVSIWSNFATSGKPIPTVVDLLDSVKWEPYTSKNKRYMEIGNKLAMQEKLNEKRYAEWESQFPTSKYTKMHSG